MQQLSDLEIWNKLRDGNRQALKFIYDSHFPYLFNYGKKIFQNTVLVEDAIQDLFVEIWQRRSNLGQTDSIRKYLAASLRRKIVSELKKQRKVEFVDGFDQVHFEAELAIEDILINQEISEEKAKKLKHAFENLSGRQKEVLYLRFYKGLDYEQISEVLGIQYQSLRNLISGGIKKLRADMLVWLLWTLTTIILSNS